MRKGVWDMKTRELKNNEKMTAELLLKEVKEGKTKNGKTFTTLVLIPENEPSVEAKLWDSDRASVTAKTPEMSVVSVTLTGNEWNGSMSYIASDLAPSANPKDISRFLEKSVFDPEKMYDFILETTDRHCRKEIAALIRSIYEEHKTELLYYPAAMTVHHAYYGGLIEHTGTVVCGCSKLASISDAWAKLPQTTAVHLFKEVTVFADKIADTKNIIGELFGQARDIFKSIAVSLDTGNENTGTLLARKMIALKIANSFVGSYRFLNQDLLFSSVLLMDTASMIKDGGSDLFGAGLADSLLVQDTIDTDKETMDLLINCLTATEDGMPKAAVPEAYFTMIVKRMADVIVKASAPVSKEILVASSALHDIGKLNELAATPLGNAEYSIEGSLSGHITAGVLMVEKEVKKEKMAGEIRNTIRLIEHGIAAHQGKIEYGAAIVPATSEAMLLHLMDLLDSRMNMFSRILDQMEPGTKDDSKKRYLGNIVYKPSKENR